MDHYELSDQEWAAILPLLPEQIKRRGRPWADHRRLINGIMWILKNDARWRDLPKCYGSWKTIYNRYRRFTLDGTMDAVFNVLHIKKDHAGKIVACAGHQDMPLAVLTLPATAAARQVISISNSAVELDYAEMIAMENKREVALMQHKMAAQAITTSAVGGVQNSAPAFHNRNR